METVLFPQRIQLFGSRSDQIVPGEVLVTKRLHFEAECNISRLPLPSQSPEFHEGASDHPSSAAQFFESNESRWSDPCRRSAPPAARDSCGDTSCQGTWRSGEERESPACGRCP